MRIYLRISTTKLKSCGTLNLCKMKHMKKTLSKAKNGKVVKNKVVDPEGNVIKTKTNTKTGRTVTKIKYDDPVSSGMKRERIVTPGLTKDQIKANEFYAKNPKAAKEDDFTPFKPGQNKMKGGATYKTGGMTNSNKKVSALLKATGRTGGISTAPKTAVPKAKYGMTMKKKK